MTANFNFKRWLQTSNINFELRTSTSNFNFKLQLQTSTANCNFIMYLPLQTSTKNCNFKTYPKLHTANLNFNFQFNSKSIFHFILQLKTLRQMQFQAANLNSALVSSFMLQLQSFTNVHQGQNMTPKTIVSSLLNIVGF